MPTLNTFGNSKDSLRMVVENGVDVSDPRIMTRTNEATQIILGFRDKDTHATVIPVNGMMIVDLAVDVGGFFMLPPEMDSVVYFTVIEGGMVYGQTNVRQGFYNIINPATYLEPGLSFDNPLVDHFFEGGQTSGTLRRRYEYPGFKNGVIRCVGPKAYMPIVDDASVLIVQNVAALKKMIQAIEYGENNQGPLYTQYYDECREIIVGEVKHHNMDPRWIMERKSDYEADLVNFQEYSLGWCVARIALDLPEAQMIGRFDLYRLVERAEMRAMWMGTWKGCLEEFNAEVVNGEVFLPARVESMLALSLNGSPIQIRSIFFNYLENGPGNWDCSCGGYVRDLGEVNIAGAMRRKFRVFSSSASESQQLRMVCKLRWVAKKPDQMMTVRCLDAIQLLCEWQLFRRSGQINEAREAQDEALACLDGQLTEYLKGIKLTLPVNPDTVPLGMIGEYL